MIALFVILLVLFLLACLILPERHFADLTLLCCLFIALILWWYLF